MKGRYFRIIVLIIFTGIFSNRLSAQNNIEIPLDSFKVITGESKVKKNIKLEPVSLLRADLINTEISTFTIQANCENCSEDGTDLLEMTVYYDDKSEEKLVSPLKPGKEDRNYAFGLQWWNGRLIDKIELVNNNTDEKTIEITSVTAKKYTTAVNFTSNKLAGAKFKDESIIQNDLIIIEGQTSDPPMILGLTGRTVTMKVAATGSNEKDLLATRKLMLIVFNEEGDKNRIFEKEFDGHVQTVTFDLNEVEFIDDNSFFLFLPIGLDYLACIRQIIISK